MYTAPSGYTDLLADAEDGRAGPFRDLEVPGVGTVRARSPLPNAVGALGMAANSKISDMEKQEYMTLFLQNHLDSASMDRLYVAMMIEPDSPENTMQRVARAIATIGTARPTMPSSR